MVWNFFFYFFPFIPSHKTPGAWSSRWKAELVLIFIFDYFLCLKRQEAAEVVVLVWGGYQPHFGTPSFLQNVLPPPTLGREVGSYRLSTATVTAGTSDAAESRCLMGYSRPPAPWGALRTNQKSKCRQTPEGTVDTRRLSPTHVFSPVTTGLTFGTLKHSPYLRRSNRTYQINSTSGQKYRTRWGGCSSTPMMRIDFNCIRSIVIQKIEAILMSLSMPLYSYNNWDNNNFPTPFALPPERGIQHILSEHLEIDTEDWPEAFKTLKVFHPIQYLREEILTWWIRMHSKEKQ